MKGKESNMGINEMLGYLNITLRQNGYNRKDIFAIIKKYEGCMENQSPKKIDLAYKTLDEKLPQLVLNGTVVPNEFYKTEISQLDYSDKKIAARIISALNATGIIVIRDFLFKSETMRNLNGIANFGPRSKEEFINAIKKTI